MPDAKSLSRSLDPSRFDSLRLQLAKIEEKAKTLPESQNSSPEFLMRRALINGAPPGLIIEQSLIISQRVRSLIHVPQPQRDIILNELKLEIVENLKTRPKPLDAALADAFDRNHELQQEESK